MDNALQISLSRQISLERKMEIVANNMANMTTTGFKRDSVTFEEYLMPVAKMTDMKGQQGVLSYVHEQAMLRDLRQGSMVSTGRDLDLAIKGDAFLEIQTPQGLRYTRDGALKVGPDGTLQTSNGFSVMGAGGAISLSNNDHDITIGKDGTFATSQGIKGKLKLTRFADPRQLHKEGNNLYSALSPGVEGVGSEIHHKFLEHSNVQPIREMSDMIEIQRTYTRTAKLLEQMNELRTKAIGRLGDAHGS